MPKSVIFKKTPRVRFFGLMRHVKNYPTNEIGAFAHVSGAAEITLRPVHTGTNIGVRYSPAFFNAFFCVHTQAIFADDEPSEHANSFSDIRWHLM